MGEHRYVYDQGWADERARLAGIEALWDRGTQALLARRGARPGAAVLEGGAGGGSIVQWLADQVGPQGRVMATDLDTRFVSELASEVVEVRQADVVTDELPEGEFDVVHTRLLLEHLAERERALDRLVAALRPGGTLVVEDYDWTAFGFESGADLEQRAAESIMTLMSRSGFDPGYGRRIVGSLAARGLGELRGEGRSLVIDEKHPGFAFFRLSFEQLAPMAVQAGLLDEAAAQKVRAGFRTGRYRVITPVLVAATARRPT
jgi:ubiquinone/menaquinone biosynthesis C-methylase UbiE